MTKKITACVVGGAGYTGGETIRLLLHHPNTELLAVQSRSQAGQPLHSVHKDLQGETSLTFVSELPDQVDVVFLCLSHGESKKYLTENAINAATRIIDLGNDFRLGDRVGERSFQYGLPEWQRDVIKKTNNIANPGCFATAIQLGLLPLAKAHLLNDVHTVGITGSTGAGQHPTDTTHFSWRANNISPYKTLTHQHLGEIKKTLASLQPGFSNLQFVPWRGDFARGIFISSMIDIDASIQEINQLYRDYYQHHPFVQIANSMIDMKHVVNTNKCSIYLEKENNTVVIHSAIDNLLKGASGQAIQNMNLMFGLDETSGLKLKSVVF